MSQRTDAHKSFKRNISSNVKRESQGWHFLDYPVCEKRKHQPKFESVDKALTMSADNESENEGYHLVDYPQFVNMSQWAVVSQNQEKSSTHLSEKVPNGDLKTKKTRLRKILKLDSKKGFSTSWEEGDSKMKIESDKNAAETGRSFTCSPYNKPCGEMALPLSGNLLLKRLGNKSLKKSRDKSKYDVSPASTESRWRENLTGPYILKPKRRKNRANRLECFPKDFKKVGTTKELRKMFDNFKTANGHGVCVARSRHSEKAMPGYFVLKLADVGTQSDLINLPKRASSSTNKSFKLIFANEDFKKNSGENVRECSSSCRFNTKSFVKMKDEMMQTVDLENLGRTINYSENFQKISRDSWPDYEANFDKNWRGVEPKACLTCLKMEENFRFQREFNTSLLEQMKNMLGQLTALIGLLNDLLNCKNESKSKERTLILSNLVGNISERDVRHEESEIPYILKYFAPMANNPTNIVHFGGDVFKESVESGDSENVFKPCHRNVVKNVSSIFYPRKHESIYFMSQMESDQIKEKHPRKKMERLHKNSRKHRERWPAENFRGNLCLSSKKKRSRRVCEKDRELNLFRKSHRRIPDMIRGEDDEDAFDEVKIDGKCESENHADVEDEMRESRKGIKCKTDQSTFFPVNDSMDSLGGKQSPHSNLIFKCCCEMKRCRSYRKQKETDDSKEGISSSTARNRPNDSKMSEINDCRKVAEDGEEKKMKCSNDDVENDSGDYIDNDDDGQHRDVRAEAEMKGNSNKLSSNSKNVEVFRTENALRNVRESSCLNFQAAGESGENDDVISGSNEDNGIKISSRAFSGMALFKNTGSKETMSDKLPTKKIKFKKFFHMFVQR